LELPAEVRDISGRFNDIHIVPPTRWSSPHTLSFLGVSKKVGQSKAGVWTRVISTNEEGIMAVLNFQNIPEILSDSA
jgi:hypothetical protein